MHFKPFKKNNKDHLEFYLENSISPVHQNIKNIKQHFERRASLYTRLGLNSNYIEKSSIIEIGPGSGHNSLYVSSLNPKKYFLVEPNETGFKEINYLYKKNKKIKTNEKKKKKF